MADVLVSTDSLLVLGGPETVNVEVDYGPQGDRGSYIFAGSGEPTSTTTTELNANIFDIYINVQSTHSGFANMYQLVAAPGGSQWTKILSLLPNVYSNNYENRTFTAGSLTISVPLINLIASELIGTVTSENFNIQHSVSGTNPLASSISVGAIAGGVGSETLPITIFAAELSGGEWVSPVGERTIHLFISMV